LERTSSKERTNNGSPGASSIEVTESSYLLPILSLLEFLDDGQTAVQGEGTLNKTFQKIGCEIDALCFCK